MLLQASASLCRLSLLAKTQTAYCQPAPQAASWQFMPFMPCIPHLSCCSLAILLARELRDPRPRRCIDTIGDANARFITYAYAIYNVGARFTSPPRPIP